jgi:hypothetical protein
VAGPKEPRIPEPPIPFHEARAFAKKAPKRVKKAAKKKAAKKKAAKKKAAKR